MAREMFMLKKVLVGLLALFLLLPLVLVRFDLSPDALEARYTTKFSKFIRLEDGTRLHYWDRGRQGAPVLVLVHGAHDAATTWEGWAPLLESDFRLIVPDLPGHGLTGRTNTDLYRMEEMVSAIHELLTRLGIQSAHFAGNSTGGNVVWRYALAHPTELERMVLLNPWGYPPPGGAKEDSVLSQAFIKYGDPHWLVRYGFKRAVHDPSVITDSRVGRWADFILRAGSRVAHAKRRMMRARTQEPVERLPEIAQPTLLLWGDQDRIIPVAYGSRFDRALPNSRLQIYRGVGHMPQLEVPERSATDARDFLLGTGGQAISKP
jgi:pimeloyl-ACP methyl ester carboxylesterase